MGWIVALALAAQEDVLVADFEREDYGAWTATGEAFGTGPARGTLPDQMEVSGHRGERLVNSYLGGDGAEGVLTSPEFVLERKRLQFLVGGGRHPGRACVNLKVEGKVVRSATGANAERLAVHSWDVAEHAGKKARLEIVDRQKGGWGHILADHFVLSDAAPKVPDERADLLARAEESVARAAARVKDDPERPVYHLLPPALWSNDPNGPVYWNGAYHVFYQLNPYGDGWGNMHWGHWKSRDLVRWEHQPIALWPSKAAGEDHVFSGCAAVTGKGELFLFYTSIGPRRPEQWVARPEDAELVKWRKHPANPILTEELHGGTRIHEWRDPFVFRHEGRTHMVCGGNLNGSKGGEAVVAVYRADDEGLEKWTYLGILFKHPDAAVKNIECPLFMKVGERWVLIVSPHGRVDYFTGDLDAATMRFTPKARGAMDVGNYYAPNLMTDPNGRVLLWGWVRGFPEKRGWNGCLTLPRITTTGADGAVLQEPAPEIEKLRGARATDPAELRGDAFEIAAAFEGPGTIRVRKGMSVAFDGKALDVAGARLPFAGGKVRIFADHSVIEVYVGGACATKIAPLAGGGVEVTGAVRGFEGWPMGSIWTGGK